jgi:hypothetical protein
MKHKGVDFYRTIVAWCALQLAILLGSLIVAIIALNQNRKKNSRP